ncbi:MULTISPECIES: DUF1622 domain-containing protein [unclassified Synechococcus]|uniref:DUF1622 domain-containing protein n=1 Tax=unclassified Synechococcus TaxID=2626047 RepID=UPI002AD565DD|nr:MULTISPECIES: DUF1622 domain-containing protein [unclassified Synechococcus]MEA5422530.1 DUF1622 domain-containing protein [Synechococcus sp. CCY9202]CAK6701500.1 hypothetical protein IFHNHDMJ_03126 [Synechococcus sp. CBW1107]
MGLATLMDLGMEHIAEPLRLCLEFLSLLCVAIGLVITLLQGFWPRSRRQKGPRSLNRSRLTFGTWLSMALEFQLGADIVSTTATPSEQNLIQLATIAVIRTLLNLFLAKELEAEQKLEDHITDLFASPVREPRR